MLTLENFSHGSLYISKFKEKSYLIIPINAEETNLKSSTPIYILKTINMHTNLLANQEQIKSF